MSIATPLRPQRKLEQDERLQKRENVVGPVETSEQAVEPASGECLMTTNTGRLAFLVLPSQAGRARLSPF
jgi:hypothetical protein